VPGRDIPEPATLIQVIHVVALGGFIGVVMVMNEKVFASG
jgi:hypothetical protein